MSTIPAEAGHRGRRGIVAPLVVGGIVAVATLGLAVVDLGRPGRFVLCPLLALTGLACPACGCLRATHDLAHLDLAGAWAMNPLWVVLVPVLVVFWGSWLARAWRGRPAWRLPGWSPWAFLAVALAFGVLRNVPALTPFLGPVTLS